jgi:hypothetical protein
VLEAREAIVEILRFLPSPEHAENVIQSYPPAADSRTVHEINEGTKHGNVGEALKTAISGSVWSEAFLAAGLLGDKASFVKVLREYAKATYVPGSSMHTLCMLKAM